MKRVLIFGNCQAERLATIIRAARDDLDVAYHFVKSEDARLDAEKDEAASADLVFAQAIGDWERYPHRSSIAAHATVRMFPYVYLAALWPFDSHQNPMDAKAFAERKQHGCWEFDYQDSLLGRLRSSTPDPEQRFQQYKDLDVDGIPDLKRYYLAEAARIRALDERLGTNIGDYILETFRHRRLFHTITHPTSEVLGRMAEFLLKEAGADPSSVTHAGDDPLSVYQTPIHPKVVAALGIRWADDQTTYRFRDCGKLTFEEYYRKYIEIYG